MHEVSSYSNVYLFRAELRGKKIKLTSPQERQPIDTELRALEREYNRKEAQLHNLQAEYVSKDR